MRILVTGAGGFIGHHLVNRLKTEGHWVRGVDIKSPEFSSSAADEFILADLRDHGNCIKAAAGIEDVYQMAADMGGVEYISTHHAHLMRNNILIDSNMLEASRTSGVLRYFYPSSACVYPRFLQTDADVSPLKETDAYPADPDQGYGWEKLLAERLATYYHEEFDMDIRVVRLHNIYGPLGAYDGGREKAPAALCRKVALIEDGGEIEIWGNGRQTRSFCYIDDCIEGIRRVMESGFTQPLNLGTNELVTIDELTDMVCHVAGKNLRFRHDISKPQGVMGRNSDNTLLRKITGWQPEIRLSEGIAMTYRWISGQVVKSGSLA